MSVFKLTHHRFVPGTNSTLKVSLCRSFRKMNFETLVSGKVDIPMDSYEIFFQKLIIIWRERCHTINRRLAGTLLIENGTEEQKHVVSATGITDSDSVQVRKIIAKSEIFSQSAYEASAFVGRLCVDFFPCVLDEKRHPHVSSPYRLSLCVLEESQQLANCELRVETNEKKEDSWLCTVAFPNLFRLLTHMDLDKLRIGAHCLVAADRFIETYRLVKQKYGRQIAANWKERTDPQKFVYEDCAIAAYLLEIWREYEISSLKFCDVGCGNGLLVYLLSKHNIHGYGVDIRRRNIWSDFNDTDLRELILNPEKDTITDANFLIGNHNDELTPWIPIMAARSKCGFFLLPCCPYDFYGRYSLKVKSKDCCSIYNSYLEFIRNICVRLGFVVHEDRLKIPSTKRHCFLCSIPPSGLPDDVDKIIDNLLASSKMTGFVAREKAIPVRNTSRLPAEFRESLAEKIFTHLLSLNVDDTSSSTWRRGGRCAVSEIAELLDDENRIKLKNSDGGLQTFLKNYHQVFKVSGGFVQVRDWAAEGHEKATKPRTKNCWFHFHHPQGCPLSAEDCAFKHPVI